MTLDKAQVIWATFSFNLWRNIVALQVERIFVATACSTRHATNSSVASCSNILHKVDPSSTLCNNFFFQLATLKFVSNLFCLKTLKEGGE